MSDRESQPATQHADANPRGLGARLAQEREAKGWSQDYVSERLKFSLRQLRALEAEDWDRLPQGVPLRGFIRNYARLLDLDVSEYLGSLPGNADPVSLQQASTLTTPLANARKSTREWPAGPRTRRRPATWLVGVLMLLIAIALIVLALYRQGKLPGLGSNATDVPTVTNTVPVPVPLETPSLPAAPPEAAMPEPSRTEAPTEPAQVDEPQAVAPVETGLVLTLTQDSWLQVRRADGSLAISRIVTAAEGYRLDEEGAPYAVVIGNIQGVQSLNWRGEAVDLSTYRGNVARLTLK